MMLVILLGISFAYSAVYARDTSDHRPAVLKTVESLVKESVERGQLPTVIFDLDDTLFNPTTRTIEILKDFAGLEQVIDTYPNLAERLETINPDVLRYSVKESHPWNYGS